MNKFVFVFAAAALIPASPAHTQLAKQSMAAEPLTCPLDLPYDQNNPFALILRGEVPGSRVYEDPQVIVLVPLEWDHPGHALVIPRNPVRSLLDMTPADIAHALDIARRVGLAQQRAFGSTGFSIVQNNARNQHVCHVHFHVIPNTPRETRRELRQEERDTMAARLTAAFPAPE